MQPTVSVMGLAIFLTSKSSLQGEVCLHLNLVCVSKIPAAAGMVLLTSCICTTLLHLVQVGTYLKARLHALAQGQSLIGQVRGQNRSWRQVLMCILFPHSSYAREKYYL